jgi:hypothetical protein
MHHPLTALLLVTLVLGARFPVNGVAPCASHHSADDETALAYATVHRARAAYLTLKGYSDVSNASYFMIPSNDPPRREDVRVITRFHSPTSMALLSDTDAIIAAEGRVRRVLFTYGVYTDDPLPDVLDPFAHSNELPSDWMLASPVAVILALGDEAPPLLFGDIVAFTGARRELRNGVAGALITALQRADREDVASPFVQLEMFFRDSDGLLESVQLDLTDAQNSKSSENWRSIVVRFEFTEVCADPQFAEGDFSIPAGLRKVQRLPAP